MSDATKMRAFEAVFSFFAGIYLDYLRLVFGKPFIDAEGAEAEAMRSVNCPDLEREERPLFHVDDLRREVKMLGSHLDGILRDFAPVDGRRDRGELLGGAAACKEAGSKCQRGKQFQGDLLSVDSVIPS